MVAFIAAAAWAFSNRAGGDIATTASVRLLWICAVLVVHAWAPPAIEARAERALARFVAAGPWAAVVVAVAVYVGCRLATPRIDFGAGLEGMGYGHDGAVYGKMVEQFAWTGAAAQAPFNRRFLLPWLVHTLGGHVFASFLVLNSLSYALGCLLVWKLARASGGSREHALVAVALFASLKFVLKFWLYSPVLTDGPGMAFLLAAVYLAVAGPRWAYFAVVAVGLACRENLIVLVPFEVIRTLRTRRGTGARAASVLVAGLLALEHFLLARHPIFKPIGTVNEWATIAAFFTKLGTPDRMSRVVVAHLNSLGVLVAVVWINRATLGSLLKREFEWLYFLAIHLVLAVAGGYDTDRFAIWYLPLVVAVLARAPGVGPRAVTFWACVVLLQLGAMETFLPWARSEGYYLARYAIHAPPVWFGAIAAAGLLAWVAPVLMLAVDQRAQARRKQVAGSS